MRILHFRGAESVLGRLSRENVIIKVINLKWNPPRRRGFLFNVANKATLKDSILKKKSIK